MDKKNAITLKGNEINVSVSVFLFKEKDAYIAYCPSLDISGYVLTEDKAKMDFEYMLHEWLKEQIANGTLYNDLKRHGWDIEQEVATEPSVADILKRNRSASRILAMPEYRKTNVHTELVC